MDTVPSPPGRLRDVPGRMKWWGWGSASEGFDANGRRGLGPYAEKHFGIPLDRPGRGVPDPATLALPPIRDLPGFMAAVERIVPSRWSQTRDDRLVHAYGKGTRDLWRLRFGRVDNAPDCVVFPETEDEVAALLAAAVAHGAVVVPFGGGTNVAGCLEVRDASVRFVCTMNLRLMNRVLAIDPIAQTVRVQAGILGPDLERALGDAGFTLGHFPDSFPYSTLGGWIATRSSGMLSDGYGNPEDNVVAIRMASPAGVVATPAVPHASTGPDLKRMCIGSEGTLGVITEVTMAVRRVPEKREFRAYLFPDFASGAEAMRACMHAGVMPVMTRLNDVDRTHLTAAFRRQGGLGARLVAKAAKRMIEITHKRDLTSACLLFAAFEGTPKQIAHHRGEVEPIYERHGAIGAGTGPGEAFAEGKFDFPHVRDFLLDHDIIVDVSETATTWDKIVPLYHAGTATFREALGRGGRRFFLGCHISHSYRAGASLYFSFGFACLRDAAGAIDPWAELEQFTAVKRAGFDCFAAHAATLSHHHAVGYEHLPWLAREGTIDGASAVDAIKATFDPHGIMNPGKLTTR